MRVYMSACVRAAYVRACVRACACARVCVCARARLRVCIYVFCFVRVLELFFCFYFVPPALSLSVFEPAENRGPVMACFLLFISCPVDERALRHPNGGAVVARLVWYTA